MSWTLCSKADVISIHPISEAQLPDLWSDAVEQLIREHLGQPGLGLAQNSSSQLNLAERPHDKRGCFLFQECAYLVPGKRVPYYWGFLLFRGRK
jgi:hypothetical protein